MFSIDSIDESEVLLISPKIYYDSRGKFFELYKEIEVSKKGIPTFVQDNVSFSKKNVIRGLHYQKEPYSQGKLVSTLKGKIFDVAVDIRLDSPNFLQYYSTYLDDIDHKMVYIPPGFAHGFCALSNTTIIMYKNTEHYYPQSESGIIWNDPTINIEWPCKNPLISDKDLKLPFANSLQQEAGQE